MLTDGKQIAAARQLLDWSQADLADQSGVSKPSIIRIEKDLMSVKDDIRQAVKSALEKQQIEFLEGGARINKKIVEIYEGDDCYIRFIDDAYRELSQNQGEILFSGSDERRSPQIIIDKFNNMRKSGIKMRSLIRNGDTYIMGELDEYRWMPDDLYIESDVKAIYNNKTGYLMTWYGVPRIVVIEDINIANENKRLFEYIWDNSEQPSKSTATVRYKHG